MNWCIMKNVNLQKKVASLEFVNDQLVAEINYIDSLLKLVGFSEGVESMKNAAREIIDQELLEE